jgi:hypothetical protein
LANLSSEAPDQEVFIGLSWGPSDNGDPWPGGPVGGPWYAPGCFSVCESTISQDDANLCAARQAAICAYTPANPPNNPGPGGVPGDTPYFANNTETCNANCPGGLQFSFTVPHGTFVSTSQIVADRMALSYACYKANTLKICLGNLSKVECCINQAFSATITATGSTVQTLVWTVVNGQLPPGLHLFGAGQVATISGTPTTSGNFVFTVQAFDVAGDFMNKTYTLCVIDITNNATLPAATIGVAYSVQLTASCGQTPLSWQIPQGGLPQGLSLDPVTGIISGTPTGLPQSNQFVVVVQTAAS